MQLPAKEQSTPATGARFRRRSSFAVQVGIGFALLEAALWDRAHTGPWSWAALAWIIGCTLAAGFPFRELGITARGLRRSLRVAGAGLLVAGAIVASGAVAGTLHIYSNQPHPALHILLYVAWAVGQEFIVQSFFFVRLERLLDSGRKAVWATGILFFLAHLPNPVLLIATAIAGPLFSELFRRYRNIYPLAMAHALVGLALAVAVPDVVHHQMKVGMAYFHWQ